jgi:5'-nucleotidase
VTNDDGIDSPGLASAAAAADPLGDLLIVAPRTQQSGAGRSMPGYHDGRLFETTIHYNGTTWAGYAAHASPAQAVQHALLELAPRRPALAISGINFGENVGVAVTISGTVGAAMEAAAQGVRAMAVSLEVDPSLHHDYDDSVNFSGAMHFTRFFAERWLRSDLPFDVDVLKLDIPARAAPDTPWAITRLERRPYYVPTPPARARLDDEGRIGYQMLPDRFTDGSIETDAAAVRAGWVAVTPISLDMTSRVDFSALRRSLEE